MKILSKEQLTHELSEACMSLPVGPVILHSDLSRIGPTALPHNRQQILSDYEEALSQSLNNRTLFVPTFNYDFCKDGIYDRVHSPSQVGVLSDHFRKKYAKERSCTPVFNFVVRNSSGFSLQNSQNVFGEDTAFAFTHKLNGSVLFLGADFSTNTFIHYVEESLNIGYRYHKRFSGRLIEGNSSKLVEIEYRVRPLSPPDLVVYDWKRLIQDLRKNKILEDVDIGYGKLVYYEAAKLFAFWESKIHMNEFYLLTPASIKVIKNFSRFKNYPFKQKDFIVI